MLRNSVRKSGGGSGDFPGLSTVLQKAAADGAALTARRHAVADFKRRENIERGGTHGRRCDKKWPKLLLHPRPAGLYYGLQ